MKKLTILIPFAELFIAVQNHVEASFPDYIATADKDPKNAETEIRVHLVKRSEAGINPLSSEPQIPGRQTRGRVLKQP